MKARVFLLIVLAVLSVSGCYVGSRNLGEVGVYYTPPYTRSQSESYPRWIEAPEVGSREYPSAYPYWY